MWRKIEQREAEKGKDVRIQQLADRPKLPHELKYLWDEYWDIKRGCDAVGFVEIQSYQQITGCEFNAFEVNALLAIEQQRIKHHGN